MKTIGALKTKATLTRNDLLENLELTLEAALSAAEDGMDKTNGDMSPFARAVRRITEALADVRKEKERP